MTSAPQVLTETVIEFCRHVAPGSEPIRIPITPTEGANLNDCFSVVAGQVAKHRGNTVFGWQIWDVDGLMLEAEFHAVWRDPSGQLHDLTPKPKVNEILFIADPRRVYTGQQVNSVRKPLVEGPEVIELIAARDAIFEFMNRGERAHQHEFLPTPSERDELTQLEGRLHRAQQQATLVCIRMRRERQLDEPCPCRSGRSFAECHGQLELS